MSLKDCLLEDKEFYDLCRKYRHFKKKHDEISKLYSKYEWDTHIKCLYEESERKLGQIADKMIDCFCRYLVDTCDYEIETSALDYDSQLFGYGVKPLFKPVWHYETRIKSNELAERLSRIGYDRWKR